MTESNPNPEGILTLPEATPGAIAPPATPTAATPAVQPEGPAPAGEAAAVDQAGVALDPAVHEIDKATGTGRLSRLGRWMLKRGNGARAAAGKPMAGAVKSNLVIPRPPPSSSAVPPPGSTAGASPGASPAHAGGIQVEVMPPGTVNPPPRIGLEEYESTAVGVSNGFWACAQMIGGPKWEPTTDEVSAWSKAIQRVWHHYQLPLVGPLVELVILGFRSAAKRADSSKVRGFFSASWSWMRGGRFEAPRDVAGDNQPGPARA